jgi:MFS family permease
MTSLPLWRERDFRRLWIAQSVSDFGARITREGLPMMAVMSLAATPAQLGLLAALASAPRLVTGLTAGGMIDSRRRRPILVAADLVRALVLVTIPLAAWLHALSIWQVYVAATLVAGASAIFDIADHAYLPSVVEPARLAEANSRFAATESLAEMGGPALAGALFQWLTAPFAVIVNAATYLASAVFLARVERPEPTPEPEHRHRGWLEGLRAGVTTAWEHPVVRPLLMMAGASGLFGGTFSAGYMIFALKVLGLKPAVIGLVIACGGAASLAGSLVARPLAARLGVGRAIVVSGLIAGASSLLVPLAANVGRLAVASLIGAQLLGDSFGVAIIILSVSLRQSLIAPNRLGRTGAAFQALAGGAAVVGALGGGWLAQVIGVQNALFVGAAGVTLAPLLGVVSPLREFHKFPAPLT